jgi:hypothetical protein
MYSGYLGTMLGLYETTTGERRFREPGSLRLRWNEGTVFEYDATRNAAAVRRNFEGHSHTLYPCEPHLIYPVCNGFGITTMMLEGRLHPDPAPDRFHRLITRYRESLEQEFMTPDGRFESMLMTSWPLRLMRGDTNDGIMAFLNHPAAPEVAERNWELIRYFGVERASGEDFALHGTMADIGRLRWNARTAALAAVALSAVEMGDDEASALILGELDRVCALAPGVQESRVLNLSNWARFNLAAARFLRPGGFHDVVNLGMPEAWRTGPCLTDASYPEVLVCRAVSDGEGLELDLAPGVERAGRQTLRLGRLRPMSAYRAVGALERELKAGSDGRAQLDVDLDARAQVSLVRIA